MGEGGHPTVETRIGTIISWVSVTYGCGFIVVFLHSAKLGLPVFELFEARYVLVGLPLATAFYFASPIASYFVRESAELAADIRKSFKGLSSRNLPKESKILDLAVDTLRVVPIVPWLSPSLDRATKRLFSWLLDRLQRRGKKAVARAVLFVRCISNLYNALTLLQSGLAIVFVLFLYVWIFYPLIPQQLGGGRSARVVLVVSAAALPLEFAKAEEAGSSERSVVVQASLLYATSELVFVELEGLDRPLSIAADSVRAIEWPKDWWEP